MPHYDHLEFREAAEAYAHHRELAIRGLNAACANGATTADRAFQLHAASINADLAVAAAILAAASTDTTTAPALTFPEIKR